MNEVVPGVPSTSWQPELRPLSDAIGVEVEGIDLGEPIREAHFRAIRRAWEENGVLLARRQRLNTAQQIRLARCFGSLGIEREGPPPVLYVGNAVGTDGRVGILPGGPLDFHSDQSYLEVPSLATVLYAIDVPARGGATLFSNGFKAYDALPPEMKRQLAVLDAVHVYDYEEAPARRPQRIPVKARQAVHPVLRRHEPTGRIALYVSRLMTWSIVGMAPAQSRELLEHLFDHQERPEFVHAHDWQAGDLIVWDNRSCNHARSDFDSGERRRLRRITVLGEGPPCRIAPA